MLAQEYYLHMIQVQGSKLTSCLVVTIMNSLSLSGSVKGFKRLCFDCAFPVDSAIVKQSGTHLTQQHL